LYIIYWIDRILAYASSISEAEDPSLKEAGGSKEEVTMVLRIDNQAAIRIIDSIQF
jgi:hypothetical protein